METKIPKRKVFMNGRKMGAVIMGKTYYVCTYCEKPVKDEYNYCPNCGNNLGD